MPDRLFLMFERCFAHPVVFLARGSRPADAMCAYIRESEGNAELEPDGSLMVRNGRRECRYAHPIEYLEATIRTSGEWQIREVPHAATTAALAEVFCGEDARDVEYHLKACIRLLRREIPRSRARGFLWYLTDGVLITFYRPTRQDRIEVLRRYIRVWEGEGVTYEPWTGSYEELEDRLYLGPGPAGVLQPIPAGLTPATEPVAAPACPSSPERLRSAAGVRDRDTGAFSPTSANPIVTWGSS
jgi:hypothetical protein